MVLAPSFWAFQVWNSAHSALRCSRFFFSSSNFFCCSGVSRPRMSFWAFSWLALSSSFRALRSASGSLFQVVLGDRVASLHRVAHHLAHLLALVLGQVQFAERTAAFATVLAGAMVFHERGRRRSVGRRGSGRQGEGRQGGGDQQGG